MNSTALRWVVSIARGDPDTVVHACRWFLLGGMVGVVLFPALDVAGFMTAFFAIGLGASGACFDNWRIERGLWMLGCVFMIMTGVLYALVCFGRVQDAIRGVQAPALGAIDFAMATLLLGAHVQFLWKVTRQNYTVSRRPSDA